MERSGAVLRAFDSERLPGCLRAFALAFRAKQIYAERGAVCLRSFPAGAEQALECAGFRREYGAYVLERR
jgi:hypothetical protein